MIRVNDVEYRNLVEEVQYLAKAFKLIDSHLNIKGQVDDFTLLPSTDPELNVSDVYAVGKVEPFNYFIIEKINEQGKFVWLNLGTFKGDQGLIGPRGEPGEKGERGISWRIGYGLPEQSFDDVQGDLYLNYDNGDIYILQDTWKLKGNIKGPQGPIGPRGEKGDQGIQGIQGVEGPKGPAGTTFNILGVITSESQLPDPKTIERNSAFLIHKEPAIHEMYIVIGPSDAPQWYNTGAINTDDAAIAELYGITSDLAKDKANFNTLVLQGLPPELNDKKSFYKAVNQSFSVSKEGYLRVLLNGAPEELQTFFDIWEKPNDFGTPLHAYIVIQMISNAYHQTAFEMQLFESSASKSWKMVVHGYNGQYVGATGWIDYKKIIQGLVKPEQTTFAGELNNIINYKNANINILEDVEIGSLDKTGPIESNLRFRSKDFIPIDSEENLNIKFFNKTYRIEIFEYSENKEFIKESLYITNDKVWKLQKNTKYVKFLFALQVSYIDYTKNPIPTYIGIIVNKEKLNNINLYKNINENKINIETSSISSKAGNAQINYLNDLEVGSFIEGQPNPNVEVQRVRSKDFIELLSNNLIVNVNNDKYRVAFELYDSSKQFIKETSYYETVGTFSTTLDPNVKYMKLYIAPKRGNYYNFLEQGIPYIGTDILFKELTNNELYKLINQAKPVTISGIMPKLKLLSYNIRCLRGGIQSAGYEALTPEQIDETLKGFKTLFSKIVPDLFIVCEDRKYFDAGAFAQEGGTKLVYDDLFKHYFPYKFNLETGPNEPHIYSKYPFEETGRIEVNYSPDVHDKRKIPYVKINVMGYPIYIIGVHPAAGKEVYETERVPYFNAIIEFIRDKNYVVLAGDFNTDTPTPENELIPFKTAGLEIGNMGYFGKFQTYQDYGKPNVYIDNVITKEITINSFEVGNEKLSDHYPIHCELNVRI